MSDCWLWSLHLRLVATLRCPRRVLAVSSVQLLQKQLAVGAPSGVKTKLPLSRCSSTSCVRPRARQGLVTWTEHCRSTTGGMQRAQQWVSTNTMSFLLVIVTMVGNLLLENFQVLQLSDQGWELFGPSWVLNKNKCIPLVLCAILYQSRSKLLLLSKFYRILDFMMAAALPQQYWFTFQVQVADSLRRISTRKCRQGTQC